MTAEEQDLKAIKQRLEKIEQQNRTTEASWGRNSLLVGVIVAMGQAHPSRSIPNRSPGARRPLL